MTDFATLVLAADSRGLVSGEQALNSISLDRGPLDRAEHGRQSGDRRRGARHHQRQAVVAGRAGSLLGGAGAAINRLTAIPNRRGW